MTPEGFEDLVRPYRRELAAHCYRMLGSLADAEDQVQETLLRAWRGIDGFEGRASVKSWLYKIATNACLDLLRQRTRRGMPHDRGEPHDPAVPLPAADRELLWIEPAPASWIDEGSPEARYASRESVQLAFVTALQHLPATQRAAVILRDVLGWSAAEVAELLETTSAAINSALQRARETLDARKVTKPLDDDARKALLERYLRAWEQADVEALAALLHEDVLISMPPFAAWIRGREAALAFFRPRIGKPGAHRFLVVEGADEIALAGYRNDLGSTEYALHAIEIVVCDGPVVREVHAFLGKDFPHWGVPTILR